MDADTTSPAKAYRFLKAAILDLDLKPGERVPAQQIAEKLQLSRTPIREALGRLEQEGLVFRAGGWGYVVRQLTFKEVMDLYRVREALELEAVREAIPLVSPGTLKSLEAILQKARIETGRKNAGKYRAYTRLFYRTIAESTGNTYLLMMLALIDDRIRWLGAQIAYQHADRPRESVANAEAVLAAMKSKDESAAAKAVSKHVTGSRDHFIAACGATGEIVVA